MPSSVPLRGDNCRGTTCHLPGLTLRARNLRAAAARASAIPKAVPLMPMLWPRAIETLVTEGVVLDASSGRGELVDRKRDAAIVRELEDYIAALPDTEQAAVSRALAKRFAEEAR